MQRICDAVSRIPKGKAATYGQIAFLAGSPRGARIVGCALACCAELHGLPCPTGLYTGTAACAGGTPLAARAFSA